MDIANEVILEKFGWKHNQAKKPLETWLKIAKQANWRHLMDVRRHFPAADGAIKGAGYTIFNIKGNSYRLITTIDYLEQAVFIVNIFTHSEYDRWSKQ